MTVLGRGLIFQPVRAGLPHTQTGTCDYDTIITLQTIIDITDFTSKLYFKETAIQANVLRERERERETHTHTHHTHTRTHARARARARARAARTHAHAPTERERERKRERERGGGRHTTLEREREKGEEGGRGGRERGHLSRVHSQTNLKRRQNLGTVYNTALHQWTRDVNSQWSTSPLVPCSSLRRPYDRLTFELRRAPAGISRLVEQMR